jgi:hypothetical protein
MRRFLFLLLAAILFPAASAPTTVKSNVASVLVTFTMPESQALTCDPSSCTASLNLAGPRTVTFSAVLIQADGKRVLPPRLDADLNGKYACDTDSGCGNEYVAEISGRATVRLEFHYTPEQLASGQLVVTSEVT